VQAQPIADFSAAILKGYPYPKGQPFPAEEDDCRILKKNIKTNNVHTVCNTNSSKVFRAGRVAHVVGACLASLRP
jgi:hypothetical protein